MKCPICNNDLVVKELEGKKYLLCGNCKKVYDPATFIGNLNNDNTTNNNIAESPPIALSICSMVFGIAGLLLSCLGIGIFPAVIGFILAIIALATHHSKGMAIAGLTTSLIGIIIAAVILITGTAINSVLEEQGIGSSEETKKESVKKDADNADDSEPEQSDSSSEPEQPDANPEPEQPTDDNMIDFNTGEYIMKYTGHAVGTDYQGNPCLLVYYDFTNNSDKNTYSATSVMMKAFQNGVQCQTAVFTEPNEGIQNYAKEIQPGTTINVAQSYSISDMSQVTLEGSEILAINGMKDTMVIQLQ